MTEAEPTFSVGLLAYGEADPVEVRMPKGHALDQCYRFGVDSAVDEANAHILAALGKCRKPFVPVEIHDKYDGYTWARLPQISKVELKIGVAPGISAFNDLATTKPLPETYSSPSGPTDSVPHNGVSGTLTGRMKERPPFVDRVKSPGQQPKNWVHLV